MTYVIWVWGGILAGVAEIRSEPSLAEYYGFQKLEVFRLSERTGSLQAGDFNHDGRTDVVLVNNSQHRLDLLLQRPAPPPNSERSPTAGVNTLTDPWRFELVKLPVDEAVASLTVGDFNHDGRDDLAYFSLPDQLIVCFQAANGTWQETRQVRLPDVFPTQWCLAAGDLNQDGQDDLVVLGKRDTYVLYQQRQGGFDAPTRLMNTSDKLGLAHITDMDGDGRNDLCYVAGESANRLLGVRRQDAQGRLGPEFLFELERPRSVTIKELDGQPGSEILTIDSRTGRLKIRQIVWAALAERELPSQLVRYGLGATESNRNRVWAWGDFDADDRLDLVVSDAEASQVLLFRQNPQQGLESAQSFPSLARIESLRPLTLAGTRETALVVHSTLEKTIGIARWKQGRWTFPEALPIDHEPAGMEVLDITGDGQPEIVYLSRVKKGKETEWTLWACQLRSDLSGWEIMPEYEQRNGVSLSLRSAPERLLAADVMGDQLPELLLLQGSKLPVVLQHREGGLLAEIAISGALGASSLNSHSFFPVRYGEKAALVVPQENFARVMSLTAEGRWQVVEQVNVVEGGVKIIGAALLQLEPGGDPEWALVDSGVKKLRLYRSGQVPWKEVDLGELDFQTAAVGDWNGDHRDDLALLGGNHLAVLYSSGTTAQLRELATFETPLEKTYLADVTAGDLNGDGRPDVVLTDTRSHYLEILDYRPPSALRHATYFKLFEEKSLTAGEAPSGEPREVLIADVTGDGRDDLLVLAHDRLLLYPQDTGEQVTPP